MQSGMNIQSGLVMAARSASRFLLGRCLDTRRKTHNPITQQTANKTISQLLHDLGGMEGRW